jgi:hypothetical protein
MRKYQAEMRLWAICSTLLFLPPFLLLVVLYTIDASSRPGGPSAHWFGWALPEAFAATAGIAFGAALVGWLLHAVIVMSGGWEPTRPDLQVADYDDQPPVPGK